VVLKKTPALIILLSSWLL